MADVGRRYTTFTMVPKSSNFVALAPHTAEQSRWPSLRTRRTSPRKPVAKMELLIQDWATNPHIVTDLDLSQPANHPDVGSNTLREKYLDGRVQFAVSEVSERSPGLIEGALAIGESTAFDFLRTIV